MCSEDGSKGCGGGKDLHMARDCQCLQWKSAVSGFTLHQEKGGCRGLGRLLGRRQVMVPRMRAGGSCAWQQIENCGEVKDLCFVKVKDLHLARDM